VVAVKPEAGSLSSTFTEPEARQAVDTALEASEPGSAVSAEAPPDHGMRSRDATMAAAPTTAAVFSVPPSRTFAQTPRYATTNTEITLHGID
jgi:hypothetical protein